MDVVSIEIGNDLSYNKKSLEEKPGFRTSTVWNAILSIFVVALILTLIVECKDYVKYVLLWVNNQDPRAVFILFVGLFTLVSFPFLWGYMLLTVACGYFFGIVNGFLTVVFSANLGVVIAHFTMRAFNMRFPVIKLVNFETLHAILRVISGPQAFKVVALARISPIPFGIQNTIFALSGISNVTYFIATPLGLLPAQLINLYLGSTLRSIGDVISDHHSTPITGYLMFCCQILVGISLMTYVVQKARVELREALSNPVSSNLHSQPGAKQIPDFIV